jgi:hypothetical protein
MPRRPNPENHLPRREREARARKRYELRERARRQREERRERMQRIALCDDGSIKTPLRLLDWCQLRGVSYSTVLRERRKGRLQLINLAERSLAVTPESDRQYLTRCRTV